MIKKLHPLKKKFLLFFLFTATILLRGQTVAGDYTFSNDNSTYSQFLDGTAVGAGNWDNFNPVNVPIGFPFYFNGNTYTSCFISDNGYITFGSAPAANDYTPISSTATNGVIAAFARDLYYGTNNNDYRIRYKTIGSSPNRVFIVQWRDARRYNFDGKFNFQIKLYEGSNTIEVHYGANSEGTANNSTNNTNRPVQVGLRGASNSDFNNRTSTSNWGASSAGTANNATISTTATVRPIANSIYRWTLATISGNIPLTVNGTWTVPCGVTNITVEAWGAGGGGGKATNAGANGGGGGGAYSKKTLAVNTGDSFAYAIGSGGSGDSSNKDGGDTWFGSEATLLAKGGKGVPNNTAIGGTGGQASQSIGDITYSGGNGANAASHSGGGGGSATISSNGGHGSAPDGGTSTAPGGNGGRGARDDDGIFNIGYGDGYDGNTYGGGGGGGRSALGWLGFNGGNGAQGYIRISYSYPNPGTPPPVTAIATISTDPTTDIGCVNNEVTLQASGGNTGAGVSTLWYEGNTCPSIIYAQEFMGDTYSTQNTTIGTVASGNRRFTSTSNDPMINMGNVLTSTINPAIYKYIVIRYRVVSGAGGDFQIYFTKNNAAFTGNRVVTKPVNSDNKWHIVTIDMTTGANGSSGNNGWNNSGGNISGWRFDYASNKDVVMDIDYIALSSQSILENTNIDDSMITVQANNEDTTFGALRIADQAAVCNGSVPVTTCTQTSIHRSDKSFVATTGNWDIAANWQFSGVPNNTNCVKIPAGKTVTINIPTAAAKTIRVENGGNVTISASNALTITNAIINLGNGNNFVVNSGGNLIQIEDNAVNTGAVTAERYVTDMDNVLGTQMDFVYWSAPITGQDLRAFSPGTRTNRIYRYNEPNDLFKAIDFNAEPNFIPGKGYAFEAESTANGTHLPNTTGYNETYKFKGVPNNGLITYNVQRSANTGTNGDVEHGYNLIGNPYPSNMSFPEFYAMNSSKIYNTAWFWTNNSYIQNQQGSGYGQNNYAVWTGTGGAPATSTSAADGLGDTSVPTGIVAVGQGFIIQVRPEHTGTGSQQLIFKNKNTNTGNMVRISTTGHFFNKNAEQKDRFWLKLISSDSIVNTQLIGYIEGATNDFEKDYDAEIMGMSSDIFYSILEDRKLQIQGKAAFNQEDKVPLGANIFADGNYTIALDNAEGIFGSGQNIYLKDNLLNTFTNLSEQNYTFEAAKGITEGRFEIVYLPEATLATDQSSMKDGLLVYRNGTSYIVKSAVKNITEVEVYDISGRLWKKLNNNSKEIIMDASTLNSGMYILKINRNGEISGRKILK